MSERYGRIVPFGPMSDRGKPQNFTKEQMVVLLKTVREYAAAQRRERKTFTQADLGEELGMSQQNAGRLLEKDDVGLSYPNATRIARLRNYDGVDDLFRAHGVFEATDQGRAAETVDPWPNRARARALAKQMGASATAVQRVIDRCADAFYRDRKQRWWVDEFLRETDAEKEAQAQVRGHHPSDAPPTKQARGRRKAG